MVSLQFDITLLALKLLVNIRIIQKYYFSLILLFL